MLESNPDPSFDCTPPYRQDEEPVPCFDQYDLVLDMNLRQLIIGDYVLLPCFNSVVDRGLVIAVHGSMVEFMILAPDTGVPETHVLDMRRPDPGSGLFGRYGYVGVKVCARKDEAAARDFGKQLLAACEELKTSNPKFNPYLVVQAKTRVEFLRQLLMMDAPE